MNGDTKQCDDLLIIYSLNISSLNKRIKLFPVCNDFFLISNPILTELYGIMKIRDDHIILSNQVEVLIILILMPYSSVKMGAEIVPNKKKIAADWKQFYSLL